MRVYKVRREASGPAYTAASLAELTDFIGSDLEEAEIGETIIVSIEEMDEAAVEALPEFDGFS